MENEIEWKIRHWALPTNVLIFLQEITMDVFWCVKTYLVYTGLCKIYLILTTDYEND